jgi:hypothetical protein
MRTLIFVFFSFLITDARANVNPMESHELVAPKLGKFEVTMESSGEPTIEPYRMKVASLCEDRRQGKHAMKPKMQELIKDQFGDDGVTVCDFIGHEFDEKTHKLTLNYMRSSENGKPGNCNAEWSQTFDLNQICAAWAD